MNYVQEFEYSNFLMNKMEEQSAMEHFVHECYILSEETMTIADLKSLNEATGIGQRIKDLWAKFMKFLKTVWEKFVHVMDQLILKDQEYLKKHEKTIKNKPVQFQSVEDIQNYPEGLKRIANTNIVSLDNALLNDKTALASKANFIDYIKLPGITGKDEEIFSSKCKDFFLGGEKIITINGANLNMTDMYNYCYDYKNKTSKILAADKKALEDNMNRITNIVNSLDTEAKKAEAQQKAAEQKAEAENQAAKKAAEAEKQKAADGKEAVKNFIDQGKEQDSKKEAVFNLFGDEKVFSEFHNQYITELKINNASKTSSQNTQSSSNPSEDNKKLSNNISTTVYADDDTVKASAQAGIETSEKQKEILDKLNVYKSVYGVMFTSKMTAAETIYKEYMKIIEAHVKSYAGDSETKEVTAKDGEDYRHELKKIIDDHEADIRNYVKDLDPNNAADVEKFQTWLNGVITSSGYKGQAVVNVKTLMSAAKG